MTKRKRTTPIQCDEETDYAFPDAFMEIFGFRRVKEDKTKDDEVLPEALENS